MDSERELGSDLTVDQIQNFIAESESNMSNLDSQLRSIQILRDKERSRIRLLRYLMAPIHVLPVEVLAEIFLFSVGGTHDASEVFRVSHVCYCWRQLAHNTPRLWMHCSITLRHHPGPSDAYITVLKTWLDLSLRLPLFLSITTRHYDFDLTDVLKTIIPVTSRLTTLDLDLTAYWRLVPLFKVPLEALEVLRLKYWYPESSPIDNWEALDLSCAPQLRSVFLPEDYEDFVFNIPWHQLTHLGLINNPDVCLEVLPRCLNLEHADIGSFAWDDDIDLPEQPIFILPNLRSLQYKIESLESDMGQFVPFFKRLSLPALTSLKLCLPEGSTVSSQYISWSAADFSRFQARSPNLQHLHLSHFYHGALGANELISILRASPVLSRLILFNVHCCIDDHFLRALRYDSAPGAEEPLAPMLEDLSWDEIDHDFQETSLEEMIRSRWWRAGDLPSIGSPPKVARLQKVFIRCSSEHHMSDELKTRMQDCADEGICIY